EDFGRRPQARGRRARQGARSAQDRRRRPRARLRVPRPRAGGERMKLRSFGSILGAALLTASLAFAGVAVAQEAHGEHGGAAPAGQGEHATAEGHGEHEEHALKPINWADFNNKETRPFAALAINFALLMFLYYRFGKNA